MVMIPMTNDLGQNADYRHTEIVLAQRKLIIASEIESHPNC